MQIEEIINILQDKYSGIVLREIYGEKALFYNPHNYFKNGVYFCTIKETDGPNDNISKLNREGIYRLSCSIDYICYERLFGKKPSRPKRGEYVKIGCDIKFECLNIIMPHPIYAYLYWICINSPNKEKFYEFLEFIDISYNKAKSKYDKKFRI
ncbi:MULTISPECIES: DUF6194 family protein [Helicobacter]|uniref:DUF6194 family protein n=1 Tax=Helicobacter ibis TaxID=2962633 RepID=A0ABT4VCT9_9HELI|nr:MULTISPECIES: DUF6194 family protein [Helicobacter]MDA3966711.1 DUF6194 family protein [Helicobacter sp. WB40]MDA3968521.1 DUF6194 family protein [Helicobacter ibis]